MKCRVKHGFTTGIGKSKIKVPKGQEGFIKSVVSGELKRLFPDLTQKDGGMYYLVDFPEAKDILVLTREVEIV